jgi:hypothetical protein
MLPQKRDEVATHIKFVVTSNHCLGTTSTRTTTRTSRPSRPSFVSGDPAMLARP